MARSRRVWWLVVLSVLALSANLSAPEMSMAAKSVDLKERLEKGLKARRPQEFTFIANVVNLVGNNTLPRSMVDSTFFWARKKGTRRIRPFQYFEHGLRVRAKRIGVTL